MHLNKKIILKDHKCMKTNNNNVSVTAQSYTHPNPTELIKN